MSGTMDADDRPEVMPFQDDAGRNYVLHFYAGAAGWTIRVLDRKAVIAMVKCAIQGDGLFLGDLNVFESARLPQNAFNSWLRNLFRMNPRAANYQRRGLGTRLLRFLIEKAQHAGMTRITGSLFTRDLAAFPNLPNWCRKRGFQVELDAGGTSGRIWRELP